MASADGGDGGQHVDIERHRLGRVARLVLRLGDHDGDGVADEAHLAAGQRMARRQRHRRPIAIFEVRAERAFQRAVAHRREIGGGIHRDDARHGLGRIGVDALEHAVRVGAAHEGGVELARQAHIVGIAALAAHEDGIFLPLHGLADAELHRGEVVGGCPNVHGNTVSRKGGPHGTQNAPDGSAAGMSQTISLARYCAAARVKASMLLSR